MGMSYRLAYTFTDPETGHQHPLIFALGHWVGDVMTLEFALEDHGLSGRVECDWRSEGPRFTLDQGVVATPFHQRAIDQTAHLVRPFFRGAFAGISDDELAAMYPGDYHRRSGYCEATSELESEIKGAIAEHVVRVLQPRRVVDAGCAAGKLVSEFVARGVDAVGFDHCPDIASIAIPSVAERLRRGSVTAIPFGPEDEIDTLVCIDVFEHVPEDRIPQMVAEFDRIGVRHLAVHISHTELEHHGHITLRPLSWWDQQLGASFRRAQSPSHRLLSIPRPPDPKRVLRIYQKVEAPIVPRPSAARSGGAGLPSDRTLGV